MSLLSAVPDWALRGSVYLGVAAATISGIAGLELNNRSDGAINAANGLAAAANRDAYDAKSAQARAEKAASARILHAEELTAQARLEAATLAKRAAETELQLAETRHLVGQRVIPLDSLAELHEIEGECGRGVNIQTRNEQDAESISFSFSLYVALQRAGIKANQVWLKPSLETSSSGDISFYSPAYTKDITLALDSKIARFFKSIGLTAHPTTGAVGAPLGGISYIGTTKENLHPDYCIMIINERPKATLNGPIFPHIEGDLPKNMELQ